MYFSTIVVSAFAAVVAAAPVAKPQITFSNGLGSVTFGGQPQPQNNGWGNNNNGWGNNNGGWGNNNNNGWNRPGPRPSSNPVGTIVGGVAEGIASGLANGIGDVINDWTRPRGRGWKRVEGELAETEVEPSTEAAPIAEAVPAVEPKQE